MGGLAVAALGTAVVFEAVLHATGGSPAAVATNLAYPLADLTLIALVVWALAMTGWRPGRTWGFIAAGLLVFSVSDCLYLYETSVGSYVHGSVTDLGWLAGAVLLGWAAWQPEVKRTRVATDGFAMLARAGHVRPDRARHPRVRPRQPGHRAAAGPLLRRDGRGHRAHGSLVRREHVDDRELPQRGAHGRPDGIGNRRKLYDDLERVVADTGSESELVLFDLNGFKHYNDSFGHPAGDALLARLGQELSTFVTGRGRAYRMGGDEFCIVIPASEERAMVIAGAARALSDRGEGFCITAACGSVLVPTEATTVADAVRLADQRMYTDKQGSRASAGDQSSGVLLRALAECHPPLGDHVAGVADLAELVALKLGLAQDEVARARLTGALHDIGKMAIPDAILEKPGPLDARRVGVPPPAHADRRAHPRRRARARARRRPRPLEPRAVRRHRLPGRPRGHGHPARLAHRLRLRRVRRDDLEAAVRRGADDRRRARRAAGAPRGRSSIRSPSPRSSTCSPTAARRGSRSRPSGSRPTAARGTPGGPGASEADAASRPSRCAGPSTRDARARRGPLGARDPAHAAAQARLREDRLGELRPRAVAVGGDVVDAERSSSTSSIAGAR